MNHILKKSLIIGFTATLITPSALAQKQHKNVLFIMADDFNFWLQSMGYYPLVKTPNLDKLAAKGVLFTNAQASFPLCNPSRNALWSGFRPSTTGIQGNGDGYIREVPGFENVITMNQNFTDHGYFTMAGGKLYHNGSMGAEQTDPKHWNELYTGGTGSPGGNLYKWTAPGDNLFSWSAGEFDLNTAGDTKLVNFFADKLGSYPNSENRDKPFFFGCGVFRPHLPLNLHKMFWDKFDYDKITIPRGYLEGDLDDIPGAKTESRHEAVLAADQWRRGIHAYISGLAYADYNIGLLLDALEKSPYAKNTIICFMGDHGWQLGEKNRWTKFAVYEQANHTTLIIYDPTAKGNGQRCNKVVGLQDIYPTLVELCGLPPKTDIEGRSLVPLLQNPNDKTWNWPALMTFNNINCLKTNEFRLVNDKKAGQLYDMRTDSFEWHNLYTNPAYKTIIATMEQQIDSMVQIGTELKSHLLANATYNHTENMIPGVVEAENFDPGSESQTYHDADAANTGGILRTEGVDIQITTDTKGSYNITNIQPGEWLNYTFANCDTGTYNMSFRVQNESKSTDSIVVYANDKKVGVVLVEPTASKWANVRLESVKFDKTGYLRLKLLFYGSGLKFNNFTTEQVVNLGSKRYISNSKYRYVMNNPADTGVLKLDLTYTTPYVHIYIYNNSGKMVLSSELIGEESVNLPIRFKENGTYYVVVEDDETVSVEKFLYVN